MMTIYNNLDKWCQIPQREPDPKTVCNFCKQVITEDRLITGPGVNICTDCIDLCNEIVSDRRTEYRKKYIEEMSTMLCMADEALTAEKAIVLACSIFDAGYRKGEI
ncbi:ClpX C4-type zinc finger protein [Kosakonia oryziphila]|uniref:ATP-dependent Clp protease ATP-binding subunit ClpX n=1 Tax=Kosakonia oryziphila TaxID=1005667 RepID=A0A1C4G229_9ENTR|nr:ClpX C4-type zinc finger protein [Kosakonia oryziphila]SCC62247.1 ATP-dependent Clp protease ATP-binding subunit ClpX [Kosakonia oryziphila]